MLAPRPARLSPPSFASSVRRTPFVVVRVERALGAPFLRGLAEYLDARHPGRMSFGVIARTASTDPHFWTSNFQSALGALRQGVSDGYYLFESGLVVGFHVGQGMIVDHDARHAAAERERVRGVLARVPLSEADLATLMPVVTYFDEVIDRRRRVVEGTPPPAAAQEDPRTEDARWRREARTEEPRWRTAEPPRPPPPPAVDDPYVVLGLRPGATDEEIREAWKAQLKLNHPDRVAHMSPALQAFAHAQTLAIQSAYDALKARRGR